MILCVCPNPSIDTMVEVDDLAAGSVHRAKGEKRYPGGKGVHVALAAAEMGETVTLLGFWAGPSGKWIREQCEKLGVRCIGVDLEGWTRSCLTFISNGEYNDTELLECGPTVDESGIQKFLHLFTEAASNATCITMSGSWPVGAPIDAYSRLLDIASELKIPGYLDCSGDLLRESLYKRPFGIHCNRSEVRGLWGDLSPEQAVSRLGRYCSFAVVTAGKEGAWFSHNGEVLHAECLSEIQIISAVGSGDCLVSGLAVAHERNLPWRESASLGVACGTANCLRPELGMLHRNDVERLLPQVEVTSGPLTIRALLHTNRRRKRATLAANFYNAETLLGVLRAAVKCDEPIILQTSPSTLKYLGIEIAAVMAKEAIRSTGATAFLHLDHCNDLKMIKRCIELGYDSVMIDASEEPFEENVRKTKLVIEMARDYGTAIEAELGYVPKLGQTGRGSGGLTSPDEAYEFVKQTGVDFLAVAIGTAHGFYKESPKLDIDRLKLIAEKLDCPLVLHGGSGLTPKQWQSTICEGVAKINFATEIKDAFMAALRQSLCSSDNIDLRTSFPPAMQAVTDLVSAKIAICSGSSVPDNHVE